MHEIHIGSRILARNDEIAAENRRLLRERDIFAVNMVSSPGSGKTSILERTIEALKGRVRMAVIEGDMETELDAQRIMRHGIPVRQITTGKACHLDAHMISHNLPWLFDQGDVRLLIIENVGNMVCPAEYDLGEEFKVAVMSVAEGDDKPLKYPSMFHASRSLIVNKIDLLPYTVCNIKQIEENALRINPGLKLFRTSCVTGEGIDAWCEFLLKTMSTPA